jgi:hypothetical protein
LYGDQHRWQIVDWKSPDKQLNGFDDVSKRFHRGEDGDDPFETLAGIYPADLLEEMAAHYEVIRSRPLIAVDEGGFTQYEVLRQGGYHGFETGEVFEAVIDKAAEGRALKRGDIRILQRTTPAIQQASYRIPAAWLKQYEEV